MAFEDLRGFLVRLEDANELIRIEREVHWDQEAGAIGRRSAEMRAQAPFFQNITGYPPGYRIVTNTMASLPRIAIAMGLPADSSFQAILDEYHKRKKNPIRPVLVDGGPCKENIHKGDDVNLYEFPVPMIHDGDGGRYLGTWHIVVTKDPNTGWVNWGAYRQMVHNRRTLGCNLRPTQDIGVMLRRYGDRKSPMPFATAIGVDPLCQMATLDSYGVGNSEADLAGALLQEPVKLVKCETVDLEVPASAEIVIEGEFLPNTNLPEGPFGEYTGYRTSPRVPRPVAVVKAITHRNDPILTMCSIGTPVDDHLAWVVAVASSVRAVLEREGLPITGVYIVPESSYMMTVVAVDTRHHYSYVANRIANAIWANKLGTNLHCVVVVDSDIDPTNLAEVVHSITTKCHPARGIQVQAHAPTSPLLPYLDFDDRLWGRGANVLFDCTWPLDWPKETVVPPRVSFRSIYSPNVQERVVQNWKEDGFS